ncbi:NAD+ kinase [Mycoplasmoides fastidiosum]|uniref:NAD+ kinase n=1 Tax=Mycoplasmoides fastidiosum TaxID=92758 RepID=A0ABU0LYD0_9BACT|nr:NAD(+)/NADH kinase [Mycoplasmoides fastidiosum]MDQ0513695.1 NAD+ kinase [Mycoplasmoides fastidiosum]UUD37882.1 NAD(+)/NADH kinase [Mycoplasmoides fastidiosum]
MQYKIITAQYEKAEKIANKLRAILKNHQENDATFEYLFLIGGDGTFAHAVTQYAFQENLKIIGINGGNVGFFSMFGENDLEKILNIIEPQDLTCLCYKTCHLIRLRFDNQEHFAFNDVVFFAKNLLAFDVAIDHNFLEHYRGSGLLFSTKYGSTGYNKSANGPVIFPEVHGWIMNELFAQGTSMIHTVNNPIILSWTTQIQLQATDNYRKFRISLDGIELDGSDNFETFELSLVESKALLYFACDSQTYIKKLSSIFLKKY